MSLRAIPLLTAHRGGRSDLEQRINMSRERDQKSPPLAYESRELLALTAYIALQSRGEPISQYDDPQLKPFIENGRAMFHQRQGQLNLSCAQCHDDNWGKSLAGTYIPKGASDRISDLPAGMAESRISAAAASQLHDRHPRAEPYAFGAPEYVDLELFLMWRARGMTMDAPGVRP